MAEVPPIVRDPYTVWLRTLQAGAIIGAVAALTLACWSYALLSSRLENVPGGRMLQTAFPFVRLSTASLNWMSVWLLTTRWPLYDPQRERRIPAQIRRLVADLLRLIVTAIFITWSLRVWGLIGSSRRLNVNGLWFNFSISAGNVGGFLLLWGYLFWLATRIRLRGLPWRAMVVLVIVGPGRMILELYPVSAAMWGEPLTLSSNQINFSNGLEVLLSSMAMLAMARYAWALGRMAKKSPSNALR